MSCNFPADVSPPDLRELALRAGRGDDAALTALIAATSRTVWRTCAALTDPGSADDMTQETFLRATRSLSSYRGDANPLRWLLTIARRVCAEEIATRQRNRNTHTQLRRHYGREVVDPSTVSDLADAIDRLPSERRDAFLLTAVAGLPYADAAHLCGCPVGTIRSRVARARAELLEVLIGGAVQENAG